MADKNSDSTFETAFRLGDAKELFKWYQLEIPGLEKLEPRVGHALISAGPGTVLLIGGGNHRGALKEAFSIDLEGSQQEERVESHPAAQDLPPRYEFLCTGDETKNIWIFGGADVQNTTNGIFKIDPAGNVVEVVKRLKSSPEDEGPSPRTQGSNSAFVEYEGMPCFAVFAGGLKGDQAVQDRNLYLFDIDEQSWHMVKVKRDENLETTFPFGCQPPAVQGHIMTAVGSKIFVHGGINGTTLYGGFHWLDLASKSEDGTHSWVDSDTEMPSMTKPCPRAAHGVAKVADVDKSSQKVYIFGGLGEKGALNDLWCLNAETNVFSEVVSKSESQNVNSGCPPPRLDFAMCAVMGKDYEDKEDSNSALYIVIHGGMNPQGEIFNDCWVMRVK